MILKLLTYSSVIILTTLNLLVLFGYATFGLGLGDLGHIVVFLAFILCSLLLLIFTGSKREINILISIFMLFAISYFLFKTTIGRGVEHPWNGCFFINVENVDDMNDGKGVIEKVEDL